MIVQRTLGWFWISKRFVTSVFTAKNCAVIFKRFWNSEIIFMNQKFLEYQNGLFNHLKKLTSAAELVEVTWPACASLFSSSWVSPLEAKGRGSTFLRIKRSANEAKHFRAPSPTWWSSLLVKRLLRHSTHSCKKYKVFKRNLKIKFEEVFSPYLASIRNPLLYFLTYTIVHGGLYRDLHV